VYGNSLPANGSLFSIESNDNTITGLAITFADKAGIQIIAGASGNTVSDNYIGLLPTGQTAWGNGTGIEISGGASDNTISDNLISGNRLDGILITGSGTDSNEILGNRIGTSWTGGIFPNGGHGVSIVNGPSDTVVGGQGADRNDISGNALNGVNLSGIGTSGNSIVNNTIAWNNWSGISLDSGAGYTSISANVVFSNQRHGIYLTGIGTEQNSLAGNIIGADEAGLAAGNGWHGVAVYDGARLNTIGSLAGLSDGNVIVASSWSGVAIVNSDENLVVYNAIGTDRSGLATNLGNGYYGIGVQGSGNIVGPGNIIAHNGTDGVRVDGSSTAAQWNPISRNAIYSNAGKGIALVGNGNNSLAAPTVLQADCLGVEGQACAGCTIEIFSDTEDEGAIYEGSVIADVTDFAWSGSVTGPNVTLTATDGQGNTSEFSAPWNLTEAGTCQRMRIFLPLVLR
jgi:parallel beta-helix repeat protein